MPCLAGWSVGPSVFICYYILRSALLSVCVLLLSVCLDDWPSSCLAGWLAGRLVR